MRTWPIHMYSNERGNYISRAYTGIDRDRQNEERELHKNLMLCVSLIPRPLFIGLEMYLAFDNFLNLHRLS